MTTDHAYIAREPKCRHATLFIVDLPETKRAVAREIAQAIRRGMTVERVTVDRAREAMDVSLRFRHLKTGCVRR